MLSAKPSPRADFDGAAAADLYVDVRATGGSLQTDPVSRAIYNNISGKVVKHIMFYRDLILAGKLLDNVNE